MSEEILKALMKLFALITKQDGGIGQKELDYVNDFLVQQIGVDSAPDYLQLFKDTSEQDPIPYKDFSPRKDPASNKDPSTDEDAASVKDPTPDVDSGPHKDPNTDKDAAAEGDSQPERPKKLTSVLDSVRVLKLCKQISKTLNKRQKVVVLVRNLD